VTASTVLSNQMRKTCLHAVDLLAIFLQQAAKPSVEEVLVEGLIAGEANRGDVRVVLVLCAFFLQEARLDIQDAIEFERL